MTRNFEIWNHQSFDMEGFALLVETRYIIRGVYNNEPAIVTDLSKQEILDMYNGQDPDSKIEYLQEWAKYEDIGQTPEYIFSDENQTIILNGEIYESYADLIADVYEDFACTRIDGKIVWRDDDYEIVELQEDALMLTNDRRAHVWIYAGKVKDGGYLAMKYYSVGGVSDVGKIMGTDESNEFCLEEGFDNPFAREISLKDYAAKWRKEISSVRQKALRGGFKTARKIGRDWVINEFEPYTDLRKKPE